MHPMDFFVLQFIMLAPSIALIRFRVRLIHSDFHFFDSVFDFHFHFHLDLDHIGQALWIRLGLLNHFLSFGRKV